MYSTISQSLLYAFPDRDINSIPIQDGNTQSTETGLIQLLNHI